MKTIILGKGEMLSNLIEGTLDAGCEIVGVFRYENTSLSKWRLFFHDFFKSSPDFTLIKKYKLHEIKFKSANSEEFKKEVLKLNADVILVGTWGEKLRKDIINLPTIACINVHPSFLPKYRGPNPYLQAILNKETKSGITFHLMDEKFDNGAILSQKCIEIFPNDTSKELKARTVYQARLLCAETLKKLEYGMIIPITQDNNKATYFPNIKPENMMLDFTRETAEEISARIRAFHPWLPCYVTYKTKYFIPDPYKLRILNIKDSKKNIGEIISINPKLKSITVLCQNNKAIEMENVKLYGAKFLTGIYLKIMAYIANL